MSAGMLANFMVMTDVVGLVLTIWAWRRGWSLLALVPILAVLVAMALFAPNGAPMALWIAELVAAAALVGMIVFPLRPPLFQWRERTESAEASVMTQSTSSGVAADTQTAAGEFPTGQATGAASAEPATAGRS